MGNTSSTTNIIKNRTTLNLTQDYVKNNIVQTTTSTTNQQYLSIESNALIRCPIDTSQKITNSVTTRTVVDDTNLTSLQNSLEQSLNSVAQQNASMVNGFASATGGNATETFNKISNEIDQTIRNTITATNLNEVITNTYNQQTGVVKLFYCEDSPIKMNQEIVANVIADNILTTLGSALMNNATISNVVSFADQKSTQENKGLDDLVKAFTGPLGLSAAAAVLICCLLMIGLVLFFLSPAGQESATTISQGAVNVAKAKYGA